MDSDLVICSRWRRFFANLIDGAVFVVPAAIALIAFLVADDRPMFYELPNGEVVKSPWADDIISSASGRMALVLAVGGFLYAVVMVGCAGGTVGKLALGVRVRSAGDGLRPPWAAVILRASVYSTPGIASGALQVAGVAALPALAGLCGLAVILPILWTARRQGLHDKAAGTVVVRKAPTAIQIDDPWVRAAAPPEAGAASHSW